MTLYHLYLSIPKFLSGAAGNDTGNNIEKAPGQHEAIRAQKIRYSVTLWQFSHRLPDGACLLAGLFWR